MQDHSNSFFPIGTPTCVKNLIIALLTVSLLSPLITFFLNHYFTLAGPQDLLPLSLLYLKKYFFFQWITYPFIHSLDPLLSLSTLLTLAAHLLLFWYVGRDLATRMGQTRFLILFFSATLVIGLVTSLLLFLTESRDSLYGLTPPLLTLVALWMVKMKEEKLTFFLFVKVKAKSLALALFSILLLMNLSRSEFLLFSANCIGILYGISWGFLKLSAPKRKTTRADIINFTSVSEDPDDIFMDKMLDKIAKVGRDGLTRKERHRMDEIVEKRRPKP